MPPSPSRKRQRRRPPAPPPPPASLVKLLGKDPEVLHYFQALQVNLEADVRIWKDRAQDWQRQVEALQQQQQQPNNHCAKKKPAPKTNKGKSNKTTTTAAAATTTTTTTTEQKSTSRGNKSSLALSSDDEGLSSLQEDSDNNVTHHKNWKQPKKHKAEKVSPKASKPQSDNNNNNNRGNKGHCKDNDGTKETANAAVAPSPTTCPTAAKKSDEAAFAWQSDSDEMDNDCNLQDMQQQQQQHHMPIAFLRNSKPQANGQTAKNPVFDIQSKGDEDNEEDEMVINNVDDLLSFPSDSDDDDDDDKNDNDTDGTKKHATTPTCAKKQSSWPSLALESANQSDDDDNDDDDLSLFAQPRKITQFDGTKTQQPYLDEVVATLDELDVQAVDENGNRRTDEEMWKAFRFALRSLCQVAITDPDLMDKYPPFGPNGCSPSADHPARQGFRLAFRSILLLESFGDQSWQEYHLNDRDDFVRLIENTLRKDIQQDWAVKDRAARLHHTGDFEFLPEQQRQQQDTVDENLADGSTFVSAKSLPKLCNLLERSYWARILVSLYLSRNDLSTAVTVIRKYLLATAPCLSNEASLHPRLAPTLSFVVLEAMVKPRMKEMGWGEKKNDNSDIELHALVWGEQVSSSSSLCTALTDVYAACFQYVAKVWKERTASRLHQIRHVAQTEYAAYQRLCKECALPETTITCDKETLHGLRNSLETFLGAQEGMEAYQTCLVFQGSLEASRLVWDPEKELNWNLARIESLCSVIRQVYVRQLEEAASVVGSKPALECPADELLNECREQFDWLWDLNPFESDLEKVLVLSTLIKCAASLADGDTVIRRSNELIELLEQIKPGGYDTQSLRPIWGTLLNVSQRPIARVINLERRHDRWKHMLCQAMTQQFLVVRGLGVMQVSESCNTGKLTYGGYAFDGEWPRDKLLGLVGSAGQLANLINSNWQPLELAPFDKDAPRNEKSVSMHSSEVACALSHIACWQASSRTFDLVPSTTVPVRVTGLIRQGNLLRQGIQLAGHASGPPLHKVNSGMYPSPVCLVMEDDATVVDGFVEALQDLLTQLPRDFHYCALGYGRPKSAPILTPWPSRPRVGVPTHLFFATAYVVSPSGVAYMEDHGPVQGPIDAWLGLLQTHNFDNHIGEYLGVGRHGKGGEFSPDQAAAILDFQSYCALPPLCSQRFGSGAQPPGKARRWKDKDTDITYSGHI